MVARHRWSSEVSHSRKDRLHNVYTNQARAQFREQEFKCIQCRQYVSCAPLIAGVRNRNHCPACLWSRHLDWQVAGDRLSGCRAAMKPIGLTTKLSNNKYATERDGELMLIHQCTACDKIVINRIAADDSTAALLEVFDRSCSAEAPTILTSSPSGIAILTASDRVLVRKRLLGESNWRGEHRAFVSSE